MASRTILLIGNGHLAVALTEELYTKTNTFRNMVLKQPYISTAGKYFAQYIKLWENFSEEYNLDSNGEQKPLSKQLRGPHKHAFFALIHLAKKTMYKNNIQLSASELNTIIPEEPYSVRSTRAYLGRVLGVSGPTVCRHLNRLAEAGIIDKIYHGTRRPFEVLINPDFMFIYDYSQEDYQPESKFLKTEKCDLQKQLRSSCTDHVSCCFRKHFNNIIMAVENSTDKNLEGVRLSPDHLPELNKNINKNTQKQENSLRDYKLGIQEQKEKSCAKKEKPHKENKIAWLRSSLAHRLYFYMIELLFTRHNIYPAEKEKAILYLEQVYFSRVLDEKQGERTLDKYRWRVEKAANYIRRNNFDFSNIYPVRYLDINNTKGFAATKEWARQAEKDNKRKKISRIAQSRRLTDRNKLERMIKQYNELPNLHTYNTCKGYIKQNIPHLFQEFIAATHIKIDPKKLQL